MIFCYPELLRFAAAPVAAVLAAACLLAQGDPAGDEQRRRVLELLSADSQARAEYLRDFRKHRRLSETPKDSTSAVVMMPECGDLIRLVFGKSSLELHRTGASGADVTCGSWSAMYPGPFTARAFGPNDIVVAMRTGNAGPQTTVLRLVRAGPAADFELAAIAAVNQVEWVEAQGTVASAAAPHGGDAIVWQAGSGTVTMLFAWEGVPRVVVADVPLASMTPPAPVAGSGRRSRQSVLGPPQISVKGECLGEGIGAAALDVDGELHVFARQVGALGRAGGLRIHVRRGGQWSKPAAVGGVMVEPEFVGWRDTDGAVCLTTPVSDVRGDAAGATVGELVQALLTFRRDPQDSRTWRPAPRQFTWCGPLRLGQQLCVGSTGGQPAAVVLQTMTGEVVERRLAAEAPRDK